MFSLAPAIVVVRSRVIARAPAGIVDGAYADGEGALLSVGNVYHLEAAGFRAVALNGPSISVHDSMRVRAGVLANAVTSGDAVVIGGLLDIDAGKQASWVSSFDAAEVLIAQTAGPRGCVADVDQVRMCGVQDPPCPGCTVVDVAIDPALAVADDGAVPPGGATAPVQVPWQFSLPLEATAAAGDRDDQCRSTPPLEAGADEL